MSHSLYEVAPAAKSGLVVHEWIKEVTLTSKDGAIARFVRAKSVEQPSGWRMSEHELLSGVGGERATHAFIVDLKPQAKGIVNLYQMRGIIGFSYDEWTPICFLLEELFADKREADPKKFKRKFYLPSTFKGRRAISPVYLRAGIRRGVWGWGKVGRINGAILFPDAWHYFSRELRSLKWLD